MSGFAFAVENGYEKMSGLFPTFGMTGALVFFLVNILFVLFGLAFVMRRRGLTADQKFSVYALMGAGSLGAYLPPFAFLMWGLAVWRAFTVSLVEE